MNSLGFFRAHSRLFRSAVFLFLILSLLPLPGAAYCPRIKIYANNEFFKSRFVVLGQVLSERIEPDSDGFVAASDYRVKILGTYRGSPQQILSIRSENDSGRFPMQKGEKYLLFVRAFESHWVIDSCGNSGPFSEAGNTIGAIKEISKAGPYGEIEARVRNGEDDVAGIRFTARSATRTFSATTGDDGWIHLRVPAGVYKLTSRSERFRIELFDLNEDRPNRLVVPGGGSVQLDYDAHSK
jgi:hypothetical protein